MTPVADGRFLRLSPDGLHVVCGSKTISIDGVAVGPGTTPHWLVDGAEVLYTGQPPVDGFLMRVERGALAEIEREEHAPTWHHAGEVTTDGRGNWAASYGYNGSVRTRFGRVIAHLTLRVIRPTFAGMDLCWCVDTGTTSDLYREDVLVARNVFDIRGERDGRLCFIRVAGGEQWTCVQHPDGHIDEWHLIGAQEYNPHIVNWRGESWVLSNTRDDRLLLRTGNNGILVTTGATYEPDCAVLPDGSMRVMWADARGALQERIVAATEPQRDLRPAPVLTIAPWPDVDAADPGLGWRRRSDITTIDIVEYMLGTEPWSREGAHSYPADGFTNSHHFQSRRVEQPDGRGFVQHTKGANGEVSATWTYTPEWVGLAWDGSNEMGGTLPGYRNTLPGTTDTAALYPRRMRVGQPRRTRIDILNLADPSHPRTVLWEGVVEGVFENTVPLGDFPAGTLHASIVFHPGVDDVRSWRERNICAKGGGCWYWHQQKGVVDKRWIGTRNAPRTWDPVPQYLSAYPKLPVPVQEDHVSTLKNRDLFFQEFTRVNDFYGSDEGLQRKTPDGRPGGMIIGDQCDVIAMRQWGYDLMAGQSADQVIAQIRNSEEWRSKHAGDPQPDPQ